MPVVTEPLHDHWWWRPGWAPGRSMLTFHLTFADAEAVCTAADAYRAVLAPFEFLDDVPNDWLHLTLQDVGFLDEITSRQVDDVADAAQDALRDQAVFAVEVQPAQVGTEGVFLTVSHSRALDDVRAALRRACITAGLAALGPADGFWPHISVGYAHASAAADPVVTAVAGVHHQPFDVNVSRVDLIALRRDSHLYEWLPIARIHFGG